MLYIHVNSTFVYAIIVISYLFYSNLQIQRALQFVLVSATAQYA